MLQYKYKHNINRYK